MDVSSLFEVRKGFLFCMCVVFFSFFFFFIPASIGKQEFLDSNTSKGINFPSDNGIQEIFFECTKNYHLS